MRLFGISLGQGNAKAGEVFTFSLPSHASCPGASPWCLEHCYPHRYERLRPVCLRAYQRNLVLTQRAEEFVRTMIGVLPRILPCVRLRVSANLRRIPANKVLDLHPIMAGDGATPGPGTTARPPKRRDDCINRPDHAAPARRLAGGVYRSRLTRLRHALQASTQA